MTPLLLFWFVVVAEESPDLTLLKYKLKMELRK